MFPRLFSSPFGQVSTGYVEAIERGGGTAPPAASADAPDGSGQPGPVVGSCGGELLGGCADGMSEICGTEIAMAQVGIGEVGTGELRAGEGGGDQLGATEGDAAQVCVGEIGS